MGRAEYPLIAEAQLKSEVVGVVGTKIVDLDLKPSPANGALIAKLKHLAVTGIRVWQEDAPEAGKGAATAGAGAGTSSVVRAPKANGGMSVCFGLCLLPFHRACGRLRPGLPLHARMVWSAAIKITVSYRMKDSAFGQQCVEAINAAIEDFAEAKVSFPTPAGLCLPRCTCRLSHGALLTVRPLLTLWLGFKLQPRNV